MIEKVNEKEARYNSVDDIPIERNAVILNRKYCEALQESYSKIRKEFYNQWRKSYKECKKSDWKKVSRIFDRNFINSFLCIWKEKVFEKSQKFSKQELDAEKEKEIIEEALFEGTVQKEIREYFLENIPAIALIISENS